MKIQYVRKEQKVLEILNNIMAKPEQGNITQHRKDLEAYNTWKRKNSFTRITLLSNMENDVMREYHKYDEAMKLWTVLKEKLGGTSLAKLRKLTIRFDTYKKQPKHNRRQHLKEMSNMMSELKEQQVQTVICSLPHNREHMQVHLTYNTKIKTFDDIVHHFKLEEDKI